MNQTQGSRVFFFFLSFVLALSLFAPILGFSQTLATRQAPRSGLSPESEQRGKLTVVRTDDAKSDWWYANVQIGKPALSGKNLLTYITFADGWEGMIWHIGEKAILGVPTTATVLRFAVKCGPINVEWRNAQDQQLERPVLGSGNCINNAPDGDVTLYSPDGYTQLEVFYRDGRPVGQMEFSQLTIKPQENPQRTYALEYRVARGTAATVMRNGIPWLEFGNLETYDEINMQRLDRFVGGKTDRFLPTGNGKCSQQRLRSNEKGNGWEIFKFLKDVEPCTYSKMYFTGRAFTIRTDGAFVDRLAAFTAADEAEKVRDKESMDANIAMNAERDRRFAQSRREDAAQPSTPFVPSAIAGMNKLMDIQRDSERYGAELRAARPVPETRPQPQSSAPPAPYVAPSTQIAANTRPAPELPKYQPPVVIIPKGRETCPPGSSPARHANGQYVTIPPAAYCIKDPQSASGSSPSSTSSSDRPLSASATTTRPPTSGSSGGNTGSDAPRTPTTVKQPPKTEWGPIQLEAFAICRKGEKSGKWWCDGPGQDTIIFDDPTVEDALKSVDCSPATSAAGARTKDGKPAELYRCGFGLRSYDRNIAKIHGVVTAPRSYMCPKYHGAKCTDFYDGQDKR